MIISTRRSTSRWLGCAIVIVAALAAWPAAVSTAAAADRSLPAVARPMWTGFYLGAHGGGGWSDSRINHPAFQATFDYLHAKGSGGLGGVQIGADWQFGPIVIGGEFDASWSSLRGRATQNPDITELTVEMRYRALITGTMRVGYASGGWLGYVKGGAAWADINFYGLGPSVSGPEGVNVPHFRTGLTGGVGVEVQLYGNVSGKLEYNAMYFGQSSIGVGDRGPLEVDHMLHVVKAGLNLRFGGDYISARY